MAVAWLVAASIFFYGWWNPAYVSLILLSILFNYALGVTLSNKKINRLNLKIVLFSGITANLGLLGYYKYANFFIANVALLADHQFNEQHVILPLAISFFTFQQIAYLVDAYQGGTREYNFLHYCLFVTFFPQLIAGPIVHHKEMLPQFFKEEIYKINYENLAVGLTIFFIGLFKKVVLADGIAVYSTPVFDAAASGYTLTFFEAWGGALSYTFQLYFDFSGYSDMAIGLARLFGIRLPLNFYSPYKATNIIDFWRRWHMTLSRFLRDYLYIPLGGNRNGSIRRFANIFITMVLGGLWHGAGWTFIAWGAFHGFFLISNHIWHYCRNLIGHDVGEETFWGSGMSRILTFTIVTIGWVFFRSASFGSAVDILKAMAGMNGFALLENYLVYLNQLGGLGTKLLELGWQFDNQILFKGVRQVVFLFFLGLIVWFMPNTQQFMSNYKPVMDGYRMQSESRYMKLFQWRPSVTSALFSAFVTVIALLSLTRVSEFLYFQF